MQGDLMEPLESRAAGHDSAMCAMAMALAAVSMGYAIDLNDGLYSRQAILFLSISLAFCAAAIVIPPVRSSERLAPRRLPFVLGAGIAVQTVLLVERFGFKPLAIAGFGMISLLGLLQASDLRWLRIPALTIMVAAFVFEGGRVISKSPHIDVYTFDQKASAALLHGSNPYEVRIPNIYSDLEWYGPRLVDQRGYLTFGFPYPPMSLLMMLPGFLLGGDVRYAQLVAIVASALLMGCAQPGRARRIGALAGILFLTTPCVFFVLGSAWTEPLLILNFSLLMLCACRWRKGLPWALGLFLSTKQYSVLALPLLPLLVRGPGWWKELRGVVIKAGIVVAMVNLPFLLWNVREFTKGVVLLQFLLSFRKDALSYLVSIYSGSGANPPLWIFLPVLIASIVLALWRGTRSPAGFAAAVTLVSAFFFAFNKSAFCNYYYFAIATACWSIAAAKLPEGPGPGSFAPSAHDYSARTTSSSPSK